MPPLEEFMPYLEQIWDSKILTNSGPFHEQLEEALCDYLGVKEVALFSNGTLALMTALQVMNLSGEVITTPYSFIATSHSLLWNHLTPVFVDVDPATFNIDPIKVEQAITAKTSAILGVHCYGNPCDVVAIESIADAHGLKVIYDAAHAFGVTLEGKNILNHGDLSVLSFHATKVFNTFEGGAIICHDSETKDRLKKLKNFGYVNQITIDGAGINAKMSEINAAFGLVQLNHIDASIDKRHTIDTLYRKGLKHVTGIDCLPHANQDRINYSYFPIMVKDDYPLERDALFEKLQDNDIHTRRYFYPLISDFPTYNNLPSAGSANLPIAHKAASEVICLPLYPHLPEADIKRIIHIIASNGKV